MRAMWALYILIVTLIVLTLVIAILERRRDRQRLDIVAAQLAAEQRISRATHATVQAMRAAVRAAHEGGGRPPR